MSSIRHYLLEVFRGADQLLNALGGGFARESISGRLGRLMPDCRFCRWLDEFDLGHCRKVAAREKPVVDLLLGPLKRT